MPHLLMTVVKPSLGKRERITAALAHVSLDGYVARLCTERINPNALSPRVPHIACYGGALIITSSLRGRRAGLSGCWGQLSESNFAEP